MPWINKKLCTGCQTCIDTCPTDAILLIKEVAVIQEDECIRCGTCHDICSKDAVRHDGERIPDEVQTSLAWAKKLLNHDYYSDDIKKQKQLLERLQRFFTKEKKVAEKTIEQLKILQHEEYTD
ncbi:MAG: ferredoxin [Desulfobacteraceae bacterium 4572_35.1]|nr:MAG: ferredoxin [Desulfobacteraceae bacterium 4572_35.1]